MNYTKGEWKVTDTELDTLTSEDNIRIGCINGSLDQHIAFAGGRTTEDNIANAHLIAAAPDMYEALQALALNLKYVAETRTIFTLKQIAEKALAKAEGR